MKSKVDDDDTHIKLLRIFLISAQNSSKNNNSSMVLEELLFLTFYGKYFVTITKMILLAMKI